MNNNAAYVVAAAQLQRRELQNAAATQDPSDPIFTLKEQHLTSNNLK